MAALRLILLVTNVVSGILLALIALPLARRRVGPNSLYGFRVRRTLEDPKVWYEANEYAGRCLFWTGIWIASTAVALYFVPTLGAIGYAWASLACMTVGLAVGLVLSFRFLNSVPGDRS